MLTSGPAPLTLDGAAAGYGLPARAIGLRELRALLLHPATSRAARDAAWRQIITATQHESPAWLIGAVGMALPALWRMAADLSEGYDGEVADLHAALLTGFVTAVHRIDTTVPGIITRLRWAAYRAGLLARYHREGVPSVPLPPISSAPPPPPWEHPDLILADAVAKGVLSPLQAELIGRSRLEDLTLKQAAAELGVSAAAAYKARRRGEARLVAAIASGDVEHRVSNYGPESGLFSTRAPDAQPASPAPEPDAPGRTVAASGAGLEPAGGRGRSAGSDGTRDADPADEKGVFCGPAHQPHTVPEPPAEPPSGARSSQAKPLSARPVRSRQRSRSRTRRRNRGTGKETS
jgi:hypothetical protein